MKSTSSAPKIKRVCDCGEARGAEVDVTLDAAGRADLNNIQTCGSVLLCPFCAAKVARQREKDIEDILHAAQSHGLTSVMLSFGVSHDRDDPLLSTYEAMDYGYKAITGSDEWTRVRKAKDKHGLKQRFGIIGWFWINEFSHTAANGWHPHRHMILICEATPEDVLGKDGDGLRDAIMNLYEPAVRERGFNVSREHGIDLRIINGGLGSIARYLTKEYRVDERSDDPRKRTPLQIGLDAAGATHPEDFALFREYAEFVAHFQRFPKQYTLPSLREKLGLAPEKTDEEIAVEEDAAVRSVAFRLPYWSHKRLGSRRSRLLDILETRGVAGAVSWLDLLGVAWLPPREETNE